MCDYSLQNIASRPAKVGDKLVVRSFGTGTKGFADQNSIGCEVVCVLPGTEIAFDRPIETQSQWWYKTLAGIITGKPEVEHKVAVFRQINVDDPHRHHDALETPDGMVTLLTCLNEGQMATVLQLPARPKSEAEAAAQRRLEIVG